MALEIDEIERTRFDGGASGDLRAPCGRNPRPAGYPHVHCRPQENGVPGKIPES